MKLVDLFEYMHICYSHDRKSMVVSEDESVLWCLLKYLGASDILNLKLVCRSGSKIATKEMQMKAIKYGNLEDNIRVNFWLMHAPFFEL